MAVRLLASILSQTTAILYSYRYLWNHLGLLLKISAHHLDSRYATIPHSTYRVRQVLVCLMVHLMTSSILQSNLRLSVLKILESRSRLGLRDHPTCLLETAEQATLTPSILRLTGPSSRTSDWRDYLRCKRRRGRRSGLRGKLRGLEMRQGCNLVRHPHAAGASKCRVLMR